MEKSPNISEKRERFILFRWYSHTVTKINIAAVVIHRSTPKLEIIPANGLKLKMLAASLVYLDTASFCN